MSHTSEQAFAFLNANTNILDIAVCEFADLASEAGFSNKEAAAIVSFACKEAMFATLCYIPDDWEEHKQMFRRIARELRTEANGLAINARAFQAASRAKMGREGIRAAEKTREAQSLDIEPRTGEAFAVHSSHDRETAQGAGIAS